MRTLLFCILLLLPGISMASESVFSKATEAYEVGDYDRCSSMLDSLSVEGWYSPALFMNLGNAYFRNNKLGAAILNYEKALLLAPDNEEVIHNLEVARKATYDKQEIEPSKGMSIMFRSFVLRSSPQQWLWFGFMGMMLSSLLILPARILRWKHKGVFTGFGVFFALTAIVFFTSAGLHQQYLNSDKAVVMSSSASVLSEPKVSGEELFNLHEGTTVVVEDETTDDEWVRIELKDKSGYIRRSDIAMVSLTE